MNKLVNRLTNQDIKNASVPLLIDGTNICKESIDICKM